MTISVELWELTGPYWRLPIRVVWHAELAEIRVGFGARLTSRMTRVAEEKLGVHARREGNVFWLQRESLKKIARKSDSDDPEEVIEWMTDRRGKERPEGYQAMPFIQAYCGEHYALIRDPVIAEAIYVSFCRFMLHWLLNEGKEVNLIFAKLNALMLRRNWQSATAKYEHDLFRKHHLLRESFLNPDVQSIVNRGVADYFIKESVTAWDQETKIYRHTLDCQVTEEFRDFETRLEKHRKRRNWVYNRGVLVRLKRQIRKVIESYAQYLRETRWENGRFVRGDICSVTGKFIPRAGAQPRKAVGAWDSDGILRETPQQSAENEVVAPDEDMPEMPDLQPESEDMRDTGELLPEQGNV
jgi:hypothetical protein